MLEYSEDDSCVRSNSILFTKEKGLSKSTLVIKAFSEDFSWYDFTERIKLE